MSYLSLAGIFVLLAAAGGALAIMAGRRRSTAGLAADRRSLRRHAAGAALAFLALAVLTAVFDSVMIAADLFSFGTEHLVGLYVGLAPVEDFSYPLVCVALLPALWWWRTRR